MAESLHERYDRDERRLLDTAATELPTDNLLDAVIDVASPVIGASAWDDLPADAPPRTTERYTAAGALTAMALRAARTTALTVRAGYAAEALADVRRLFEIAGHAQRVAEDPSGQYAANWLGGRGRSSRPRVVFGEPDSDPMWKLMSGQAHAQFDVYAGMSAKFDEGAPRASSGSSTGSAPGQHLAVVCRTAVGARPRRSPQGASAHRPDGFLGGRRTRGRRRGSACHRDC